MTTEERDLAADPEPAEQQAEAGGWRYRVGMGVLVTGGVLVPLASPLVSFTDMSTAAKATITGLMLAGIPEVAMVLAAAVLGKEGFARVKERGLKLLRRAGPPDQVGPTRHAIGITLLVVPLLYAWVTMYVPELIPGFATHRIALGASMDGVFLVSFFVLGGDFWDKLRSLFVREAKAQFPGQGGAPTTGMPVAAAPAPP